MSHLSVRPLTEEEESLIDSLESLPVSGISQGIAKTSSITFENRTFVLETLAIAYAIVL